MLSGAPFDLELQIQTAPGSASRWIRITGRSEMAGHGAYRLSGSVQNIDHIKRAQINLAANEVRFRTLTELLPVGI